MAEKFQQKPLIAYAGGRAGTKSRGWPWPIIIFAVVFMGLVAIGLAFLMLPAFTSKSSSYVRGPCYTPPGGKPPFRPGAAYLYEAPPERQAILNAGVKELTLGMCRQDVRNIIGDPDIDQAAVKPMVYNLQGEYVGITWRYIIRSVEPDGTNLNDVVISVYFTPDDHLRSIADSRSRAPMPRPKPP